MICQIQTALLTHEAEEKEQAPICRTSTNSEFVTIAMQINVHLILLAKKSLSHKNSNRFFHMVVTGKVLLQSDEMITHPEHMFVMSLFML